MPIIAGLKKAKTASKKSTEPLWQGPCGEGPQGGITSSLLSRYFVCPERFRVQTIEGLKPPDRFSAPLDFGNMWHVCEEAHAKEPLGTKASNRWDGELTIHARSLCTKYPLQQEEIDGWYQKCAAMFPLYVKHWSEHPDVKDRTPLFQEQVFDVPYQLSSGRMVRLRGKWDAGDLIGKGKQAGVYLQENKSKSSIDSQKIAQQLTFDLQTMFYVVALLAMSSFDEVPDDEKPIWNAVNAHGLRGVRYNVVRRSAHKSPESMLKKIAEDEASGRIGEWFARWKVDILPCDIERFKQQCLDPTLENLCDDFEWWSDCKVKKNVIFEGGDPNHTRSAAVWDWKLRLKAFPYHTRRHTITPFGIYNVLAESGSTDLDEFIRTGSRVGLQQTDDLFPELK